MRAWNFAKLIGVNSSFLARGVPSGVSSFLTAGGGAAAGCAGPRELLRASRTTGRETRAVVRYVVYFMVGNILRVKGSSSKSQRRSASRHNSVFRDRSHGFW